MKFGIMKNQFINRVKHRHAYFVNSSHMRSSVLLQFQGFMIKLNVEIGA